MKNWNPIKITFPRLMLFALLFLWSGCIAGKVHAQQIIGRPIKPLGGACPSLQSGLVAYYMWNNNDVTTANGVVDANGATNNLSWATPNATNLVYFTPGVQNYAVEVYPIIDNNGAVAQTGSDTTSAHQFNFPTSSFSIAGWLRIRENTGSAYFLISQGLGGNNQQYAVAYIVSTKQVQFYVRQSDGVDIAITDSTTLSTNTWYFWAARYTNNGGAAKGDLKLWVNTHTTTGQTTAVNSTLQDPAQDRMRIGALSTLTQGMWRGAWDEIAFWNRAITDAEVDCLYNSGNGRTYPLQ